MNVTPVRTGYAPMSRFGAGHPDDECFISHDERLKADAILAEAGLKVKREERATLLYPGSTPLFLYDRGSTYVVVHDGIVQFATLDRKKIRTQQEKGTSLGKRPSLDLGDGRVARIRWGWKGLFPTRVTITARRGV